MKRIYTPNGPVQVSGGLYIERQADRELLRHCMEGTYAFVLSSRQVGKTSLMNNVADQIERHEIDWVIIDLQEIGSQVTVEQWYQGLLTIIEERFSLGVDVKAWWRERAYLGEAQRFRRFLREELLAKTSRQIVIFIDEIDTTLSLDFSDDFFAAIRAMHQARNDDPAFRRLSFVLVGVATPHDLIDDPKRTPFNIGEFVKLDDFALEEALPLAGGFGLPEAEARKLLGWVLKWTDGQPCLTQQLCIAIAEGGGSPARERRAAAADPSARTATETNRRAWNETQVDALVAAIFFGPQAEQNVHLKAVRDLLTKRAPAGYEEAVLKTYLDIWRGRRVPDEARSVPKSHLKLTGVVQPNGSAELGLRNDIYRTTFDDRWIKENMPANWAKRLQRTAVAVLVSLLIMNVPIGIFAWVQRDHAVRRANDLAAAFKEDEEDRAEADKQAKEAERQAELAREEKGFADKNAIRAKEQADIALASQNEAIKQRDAAQEQRVAADQRQEEAERLSYDANLNLAVREFESGGNSTHGYELLNACLPVDSRRDYREFSWYLLWKGNHNEVRTLSGHGGGVLSVASSADGKTLASGSNDKTIKLWDVASGKEVRTFSGHQRAVRSVAWSGDGKTLASGSEDGTIKLWDVASGKELTTLRGRKDLRTLGGQEDWVNSVAWSGDGKTLASASIHGTIKLLPGHLPLLPTPQPSPRPIASVRSRQIP
jgi:hypothetical protein